MSDVDAGTDARTDQPRTGPAPVGGGVTPSDAAADRFADHVGVQVTATDGTPCGCGATAVLRPPGPGDEAGAGTVPTGAVLALVDATARRAAEAAVTVPGYTATLVPTATGVQYRRPATGPLTARASVPCEGQVADRADEQGTFRFSVAVDVDDPSGERVATGTVQWTCRLDRTGDTPGSPEPGGPSGAPPPDPPDPAA